MVARALLLFFAIAAIAAAQRKTPCPDILSYERRDDDMFDRWIANVNVTNMFKKQELKGVWLRISLDQYINVFMNSFGDVITSNNLDYTIRRPDHTLGAGKSFSVRFLVAYNAADKVPSVARIRLNGRTVCFDPDARIPTTTLRPSTTSTEPSLSDVDWDNLPDVYSPIGNDTAEEESVPCGTVVKKPKPLIVKGQPAQEGNWPWHAAIYRLEKGEKKYKCGGNLISKSHVLTAAHCAVLSGNQGADPKGFYVALGNTRLNSGGPFVQLHKVRSVMVHPSFEPRLLYNDVAVLRTLHPVRYNEYVRPVCLWSGTSGPSPGSLGTVVGWGLNANNVKNEQLQETALPVMDFKTCLYSNPDFFSAKAAQASYCAGYMNGTTPCSGDSGGGMVFPVEGTTGPVWTIGGVVSNTKATKDPDNRCDPESYVVFTDVAFFTDWIRDNIGNVQPTRESRPQTIQASSGRNNVLPLSLDEDVRSGSDGATAASFMSVSMATFLLLYCKIGLD